MSDGEALRLRMELLGLRLAILKKYEGLDSDSSSLGEDPSPYCSFCGKARNEVEEIVCGGNVCICNECVTIAHEILFGSRPAGARE